MKKDSSEGKFDKSILNKRKFKIGILKARQIIGLNDIINRNLGNICLFNCLCTSYEGELYYIPYNKFLSICENESQVKLLTNELLYQNIYYLIQRLLSHKQLIIEKASRKEDENDKNLLKDIKVNKKPKSKIINKIKINFKNITNNMKFENKTYTKYNYSKNWLRHSESKSSKNLNYKKLNEIGNRKLYSKETISHNLSEKKCSEDETFSKSNKIKDPLKNSFISTTFKSVFYKNLKFNIFNSNSKQFSNTVLFEKKGKSIELNTINTNKDFELPILVINDKEVKVNEINYVKNSIQKKINYDVYKNFYKNEKNVGLANKKELKNIILFGNYNEKFEAKQSLKLFQKSQNLLLNRTKTSTCNNSNKKLSQIFKLKITSSNSLDKKTSTNIKNCYSNIFDNYTSRNKNIFKRGQIRFRSDKNILIKKLIQKPKFEFSINLKNNSFNKEKEFFNKTVKNKFFKNTYLNKNLSEIFFKNYKIKDSAFHISDSKNKCDSDFFRSYEKKNKNTQKSDSQTNSVLLSKGIWK